jgi:hypothetical protein
MASFTLSGVEQLQRRIRDIERQMKNGASSILEKEVAEKIKDRAKEYCPERSGKLVDSIVVVKSGVEQGRESSGRFNEQAVARVSIQAGNDETPHALAVHEHPSRYSPPSWDGVEVKFTKGGPKFLERALNEHEGEMLKALSGVLDKI